MADRLNTFLNESLKTNGVDYIIGSDTDSIMVTMKPFVDMIDPEGKAKTSKVVDAVNAFCEAKIEKFLVDEYEKLAKRLNAKTNTLDMKREAISDVGIIRAKKNYAFRVWDMEHVRYAEPKLKIAGLETQRSDKPRICRDALKEMISVIFDGTEEEIQKKVEKFRGEFMTADLTKISFPKGVSVVAAWTNPDGSLKSGKGTIPFNSKASVAYNMLLKATPELHGVKEYIKDGTKIKYVYLKEPNPTIGNIIAFIDDLPKEFGLEKYIDKQVQFEKAFLDPLESLLKLVGWNSEKKASFEDLFE